MPSAATREQMLETVQKLGERACAYAGKPWPNRMCDCKYGIESDTSPRERVYCGEQTGCPELRDIFSVLKAMSDKEYATIKQRISDQMAEAYRQWQESRPGVEIFNENRDLIGVVTPESVERLREAGLIEQERAPGSEWVVASGKAKELRDMGLFLAKESKR